MSVVYTTNIKSLILKFQCIANFLPLYKRYSDKGKINDIRIHIRWITFS